MLAHFENRGLKMIGRIILLYFLIIVVILFCIIYFIKALRIILLYKNITFILIIFLMAIYFIFVGYYASNHPYTEGAIYVGSIVGIFVIAKIFSIIKQRNSHDKN